MIGRLNADGGFQITRLDRVEVGEHKILREKTAVRLFILLAHYRERRKDVLRVVPFDPVKMEEQGIKPRYPMAAILLIPLERGAW